MLQRRKRVVNKQDFENKLNLTCQVQSTLKINGDPNQSILHPWSIFLVLASTGDKFSRGQAQNGVNFDFEVKFDHEGSRPITPQNNIDLNQGLIHLRSNLVILALMGDKLSRGQTRD